MVFRIALLTLLPFSVWANTVQTECTYGLLRFSDFQRHEGQLDTLALRKNDQHLHKTIQVDGNDILEAFVHVTQYEDEPREVDITLKDLSTGVSFSTGLVRINENQMATPQFRTAQYQVNFWCAVPRQ